MTQMLVHVASRQKQDTGEIELHAVRCLEHIQPEDDFQTLIFTYVKQSNTDQRIIPRRNEIQHSKVQHRTEQSAVRKRSTQIV